jgi:hypothetical protein
MPLQALRKLDYQIEFRSHAEAILVADFPAALREIETALARFEIPIEELIAGGGGEAKGTQRLRKALTAAGWGKGKFVIRKLINEHERESTTHEIDHVHESDNGALALEIEWNNKDPFFDRDLENFKRLHAEGAISAGVIVTRGASFQESIRALIVDFARRRQIESYRDLETFGIAPTERQRVAVATSRKKSGTFAEAWAAHFCASKFGEASTHWQKLQDRLRRGVGHPCPLLLIGIPAGAVKR